MYRKRRRIVRRRPVVRRGRGVIDRVKQGARHVARFAVPLAAAVAANKGIHMAARSSLGKKALGKIGNAALPLVVDYIKRNM